MSSSSSLKPADRLSASPEAANRPHAVSAVPETPAAAPKRKKPKAPQVFVGLGLLAVLIAATVWLLGRGKESTDDAQVEGRVISVAARVSGQVDEVLVADNQTVKKGDVLVRLDRRDLDARLAAARADAMAARAALSAAEAQLALTDATARAGLRQAQGSLVQASSGAEAQVGTLAQARADVAAAEAAQKLAAADLARSRSLFSQKVVPQADLDLKQAHFEQAEASLQVARARLSSTQAGVSGSAGGVTVAEGRMLAARTGSRQVAAARAAVDAAAARLQQAQAALQLAELNDSYAEVHAPISGVVSRRTVEIGQTVSPDRPLLALVPLDDVWVVANFKEDQIGAMKPGQKVRIAVDAYGGREFAGHLDSVASASGARFSLLPPDNASGNFVKVVQRIPVLIKLDGLPKEAVLRPGMSVEATVELK